MELSAEQLLRKQTLTLEVFRFFHDFCLKHDLTYFCIGGTAIGAVRHGGMIPWDDDIDIGMPRPDYERFLSLCKTEPLGKFRLLHPLTDVEYYLNFPKLMNTETTLIETKDKHCNIGVFIDIFPLDGAPEAKKLQSRYMKLIARARTKFQIASEHFSVCEILQQLFSPNWKEGFLILQTRFFRKRQRLMAFQKAERLSRMIDYHQATTLVNYYGSYGNREFFPKAWIGQPRLISFDGQESFVMEQNDLYLSTIYGDYMTPPPIDKQQSHHAYYYMDLDKGHPSVN